MIAMSAALALFPGCRRNVVTAPAAIAPQDLGTFRVADAPTPVVVLIEDFENGKLETNLDKDQEESLRKADPVAIPNNLQALIGQRQVFREVIRSETANSTRADYIVSGTYDLYVKLGTSGREWIPFAGTFGAKINEATAREKINVKVVRSNDGREILNRSFPSEQQESTSVYSQPRVSWLQPNYLAGIGSAIITAIQADAGTASRNASAESRLVTLDQLRKKGLITEAEYSAQRAEILKGMAH
jgi:hypothetical protein